MIGKLKSSSVLLAAALAIAAAVMVVYRVASNFHFSYAGTLDSTATIVSAKVSAEILQLYAKEGQWVKKGELLAKLDDTTYKIKAKQLDASFARYQNLFRKGVSPKAELENIVQQKESNDLAISWCSLYAPIEGLVVTSYREVGENVAAGAAIYSLIDPKNNMYAYFYVPHDFVAKLKIGDEVIGKLPEMPSREFKGRIVKINEQSEFTPKNVQTRQERTRLVYGVKVAFSNDDLTLKRGMTIETDFEAAQ